MTRTHPARIASQAGSSFWYLAAFAALDVAVWMYLQVNGVNAISTTCLLLAVLAFVLAVRASGRPTASVQSAALIVVGGQLVLMVLFPFRPGTFEVAPPGWLFQAIALLALVVLGVGLLSAGRRDSRRFAACLIGVALLGLVCRAAIVLVDLPPTFDVPLIQAAAAAAIRGGTDPYLTHIYDSGYPYLPVAAIGATLGSLFGDARWVMVAGDAMTLAGLLLIGRRLRLPAVVGATMAAVWAWWAGAMYVTWQGFPEPLLIGFLTLSVAALVGAPKHGVLGGVLLGLSVATKQFAIAMLPFLLLSRHGRRVFAVAVVTAAGLIIPFGLWHTGEFLEGTFWSQLAEPGRPYSLNLLIWPSVRFDPPYLPILVAAVVAGWLVSRRVGQVDEDAGWLAGSATLLLIAFLANHIAFVNYYSIVMLVLLLLVLVLAADAPDVARSDAPATSPTVRPHPYGSAHA